MNNLSKKQRIILSIIAIIVIIFIYYYVYAQDKSENALITPSSELNEVTQESQEKFSDEFILVHVSGAVNKEGIVELKVNSRISDALEKAGGIKEDAYMDNINLAYKLEDGMKIYIPSINDKEVQNNENKTEKEDLTEHYVSTSSGLESKNQEEENIKNQKININTATKEQLETLQGIGPTTASKIIKYREQNGKFKKIEDIKEVSGIGESKFEKIKDNISV